MAEKNSKGIHYYMRLWHRNLGFLTIGLVMVYSLSGILLIHRTDDLMKRQTVEERQLEPNMSAKDLGNELKMRNFSPKESNDGVIVFEGGQYDSATGKATITRSELIPPFDKFTSLHKKACAANVHLGWITTIFGIILFFLALSSLFMFKPGTKPFKSAVIYTTAGIILTILVFIIM